MKYPVKKTTSFIQTINKSEDGFSQTSSSQTGVCRVRGERKTNGGEPHHGSDPVKATLERRSRTDALPKHTSRRAVNGQLEAAALQRYF
jgi:hypothetical protein